MLFSQFCQLRRLIFHQSSPVYPVSESRGGGKYERYGWMKSRQSLDNGRKSSCLILDTRPSLGLLKPLAYSCSVNRHLIEIQHIAVFGKKKKSNLPIITANCCFFKAPKLPLTGPKLPFFLTLYVQYIKKQAINLLLLFLGYYVQQVQ